jgi:hypothetical protein
MTRSQQIELLLDSVSFDLQLPASLLAQILRLGAADPRQVLLDVLRLHTLIEALQTRLQFRLFCFYFRQLRAKTGGFFGRAVLGLGDSRS